MSEENNVYKEVSERVHRRFKKRVEFTETLVVFVTVNVVMWLLWAFTDDAARISVLAPLIMTGITVAITASELLSLVLSEAEERVIQREIDAERQWRREMLSSEKAKHDEMRFAHLSDDGELVEMAEYDPEMDKEVRRISR